TLGSDGDRRRVVVATNHGQGGRLDFYWQHARDNLLTPAGLRLFQLACVHEGELFDDAKSKIDDEYEAVTGGAPSQRHGGKFQTAVQVFQESGWIDISSGVIKI